MKFASLFTGIVAALATTALASPLTSFSKRDAAEVVDTVKSISTQVVELETTVQSFTGQVIKALKIQIKTGKLTKALEDAIEKTQESPNFTTDESVTIAMGFIDLQPKITKVLDALISKKDVFKKGLFGFIPLTGIVRGGLEKQKELSAQLGQETVKKLTPEFANLAPIINGLIAADFSRAVAAFS
ncbi:hypothetical protein GX50_08283 [[Emmonsia] crescens]|uniref:Antigenic cell wall galactomannoprotein n=1 Tax=[Emmonsia] crescens TaxID=73230 RepID=A0A2B7Z6I7_9EURO|nr:hypothetical protein GX50_08283 [Emmonsia crescens]